MGTTQKLTLGPKGRAQAWVDPMSMSFQVRVVKRAAYATLDNSPEGNPYFYAIYVRNSVWIPKISSGPDARASGGGKGSSGGKVSSPGKGSGEEVLEEEKGQGF